MAFGKRTRVGTPAVGGVAPRNRGWRMGRRQRGAASTTASNKVYGGSKTKMADMNAASGRRMAIAGAIIGEKFARLGANVKLGLYTISHPLQHVAAKERNVNVKVTAAERKRQKMARAVDVKLETKIKNQGKQDPSSRNVNLFFARKIVMHKILRS